MDTCFKINKFTQAFSSEYWSYYKTVYYDSTKFR